MAALLSTENIDLPDVPVLEAGGEQSGLTMAGILARFIEHFVPLALPVVTRRSNASGYANLPTEWAGRTGEMIDQSQGLARSGGRNDPFQQLIGGSLGTAFQAAIDAVCMRLELEQAHTSGQFSLIYNSALIAGGAVGGMASREDRHQQIMNTAFSVAIRSASSASGVGAAMQSFLGLAQTIATALFNELVTIPADSNGWRNKIINGFNELVERMEGEVNGVASVGHEQAQEAIQEGQQTRIPSEFFVDLKQEFQRGLHAAGQ